MSAPALAGLRTLAAPTNEPAKPTGLTTLNQSDFLKLLTAQLTNQDPTAPTDNAQFVSQMAQFSTVSGIDQLNKSVSALSASLSAGNLGSAAGLIGGTGLAPADSASRDSSGAISGAIDLPAAVEELTLSVTDPAGRVIRTLALGPQPAGLVRFRWDGSDATGSPATGDRFGLAASSRSGSVTSTPPVLVSGRITGVEPGATGTAAILSGVGPVPLTSLRRIDG